MKPNLCSTSRRSKPPASDVTSPPSKRATTSREPRSWKRNSVGLHCVIARLLLHGNVSGCCYHHLPPKEQSCSLNRSDIQAKRELRRGRGGREEARANVIRRGEGIGNQGRKINARQIVDVIAFIAPLPEIIERFRYLTPAAATQMGTQPPMVLCLFLGSGAR